MANKHSYKYSMVRRKAVGMRSAGDKGVELLTKRVKYVRRPKTLFVATRLSRDRRRVYRTIRRKLGKTGYRRDLIEVRTSIHSPFYEKHFTYTLLLRRNVL